MNQNIINFDPLDKIKDKIVYRLGSDYIKKNNQDIVYRSSLNVYIYYYVLVESNDKVLKSYPITWNMINAWDINEQELFNLATINTPKLFPNSLVRIAEMLKSLVDDKDCKDIKIDDYDPPFYVLTNNTKVYGASGILYPEYANQIYDKFKSDYYIIPSSVHELILVPVEYGETKSSLLRMIKEVNQTEIEEDEFLSNNLYIYSSADKTIKIA